MAPKLQKSSLTAVFVLSVFVISSLAIATPAASAQTQYVTASPGYINFGMTTSITVTAPAAGTYTVVVIKPDGSTTQVSLTFGAAGATLSTTYGVSTSGFNAIVNKVGTYNVFLEQGSTIVSSTSFYATNKLTMDRFDQVDGGYCAYVTAVTRGSKMFPRFWVAYASNGALLNNNTMSVVKFTLPDGTFQDALWHRPSVEGTGFWIGKVYPNWNSTWTGNYMPTATATDIYGNVLSWTYTGRPFVILPSPLTTAVQLIDSKTGQAAGGLYNGQTLNVNATIAYTAAGVTGTEILPGYLGPLDTTRGGVVTGMLGWGFFNTTSNTYGSAKNPGGLISSLTLTYAGSKGVWVTPLAITSLPAIPAGTTYELRLNAKDGVPTPNTGIVVLPLAPATVQVTTTTSISTTTATTTSVTTSVSTSVSTATATSTAVSTVTGPVSTVTGAVSTVTTTQSAAEGTAQGGEAIPTWIYAAMAAIVLVGFAIGFIVRRPRASA